MSNDIEFFIVSPKTFVKETTQELYIKKSYEAFGELMKELLIPDPQDLVEDSFLFYITCDGENDKIILEDYDFVFLKTRFFDFKSEAIKYSLYNYYNPRGIKVNNLFRDGKNYFVELTKYIK